MKNLSVRTTVVAGLAALAGVGVVSNAAGFMASSNLEREFSDVTDNTLPSFAALGDLKSDVNDMRGLLGQHVLAPSVEATRTADTAVQERINEVNQQIEAYRPLISDDTERALFADVEAKWRAYVEAAEPLRQLSLQLDTNAATRLYTGDFNTAADNLVAAVNRDLEYNQQLATADKQRGEATAAMSAWITGGMGLASLAIAGFVAMMMMRRVLKPLNNLTGQMGELAGGKNEIVVDGVERTDEIGEMARALDIFRVNALERIAMEARAEQDKKAAEQRRIESEKAAQAAAEQLVSDSFGQGMERLAAGDMTYRLNQELPEAYKALQSNFNDAIVTLGEALRSVAGASESMKGGSGEVAEAAGDLSRRTEQQAANLEETAAALDQVTATVKRTAEGATHAGSVVQAARGQATASSEIVAQAVNAMSAIEASAGKISQIIGVIDEIAFQTNLLALNAGVEAARAGEAGRGFAVVASEVRALAQRSAEAAKEIKTLISTSVAEVEQGARLVDSTGEALRQIASQVTLAHSAVTDIVASAQEQATALAQVNVAINQLDQMTQQNAAMVEQTTAASQNLANEADTLAALVATFTLEKERSRRTQPQHSAPVAATPIRKASPGSTRPRTAGATALAARDDWQEF